MCVALEPNVSPSQFGECVIVGIPWFVTYLIQFYIPKKWLFVYPIWALFFDEVARYEFGRLHQNGPETAQSARELASLDHVLFVTLRVYSV